MRPSTRAVRHAEPPELNLTDLGASVRRRDAEKEPPIRIHLSAPLVGDLEVDMVTQALRSGWVAPVGPDLEAFEQEVTELTGTRHAVALSSGTAAIHLGLRALGVGPGDDVVVPTLTFAATAFAVSHIGARPVFLDSEEDTWNLDPLILEEFLEERAKNGRLPAAIITVDLFGRVCDHYRISGLADRFGIPVLEDAAEALGATRDGRAAGTFGKVGVFSFNGNKIVTTSGGGMLITEDAELAGRVRYWATQAREDVPWYEHLEIGHNYRLSNVLAALGRAQLRKLPWFIERRRAVHARYRESLGGHPHVSVVGEHPGGGATMWLTTVRLLHVDPETVRMALRRSGIEARHVWKPMHLQPVFSGSERRIVGVADRIFAEGLCLPSAPSLSDADVTTVAEHVLSTL